MNKRGIVIGQVVFIILNLAFFVLLLIFIRQSASGRLVYEQAYAKQIALLIDEAKPSTTIYLDMQDISEEYEKQILEFVKIDNENKKVNVKLGSVGGYGFNYFTDAKISLEQQGVYLVIKVGK